MPNQCNGPGQACRNVDESSQGRTSSINHILAAHFGTELATLSPLLPMRGDNFRWIVAIVGEITGAEMYHGYVPVEVIEDGE